jgi:hypothetical protein
MVSRRFAAKAIPYIRSAKADRDGDAVGCPNHDSGSLDNRTANPSGDSLHLLVLYGAALRLSIDVFCLAGHNVLEASARLNFFTLNYFTANVFHILLEVLVTFTLPFGLAIYAWIIARSPPLRRWLGFMIGVQAVLLFLALGSFVFPSLSDFVTYQLLTVYAIILAVAKAVWFLSPVAGSKHAAL